jgi:hypothetical protein
LASEETLPNGVKRKPVSPLKPPIAQNINLHQLLSKILYETLLSNIFLQSVLALPEKLLQERS